MAAAVKEALVLLDYEAAVLSLDADGTLANLNQFNASALGAIAACRPSVVKALNSLIDTLQESPSQSGFKVYPRASPSTAENATDGETSARGLRPARGDLYEGTRVFDMLQSALEAVDEERADQEADAREVREGFLVDEIQGDSMETETIRILEIQVRVAMVMSRAFHMQGFGVAVGMGYPAWGL